MMVKRSVREIEEFCGWDLLIEIVERAQGLRIKALIATLFLTGGRISEVLSLKRSNFDLSREEEIIVRRMPVGKRFKKVGERIVDGKKRWITEKVKAYRSFPIMRREPLVPFLVNYLETLKPRIRLFTITRVRAFQIIRGLCGKYPHWFRAQRACQLAEEYDLELNALMDFFSWRDVKTAMRYTSLGWRGLARKMRVHV